MSSPDLSDARIVTIALCVFTGTKPHEGQCTERAVRVHPDVDCLKLYFLGDALASGQVSYDMPATTVTGEGAEPVHRDVL